MCQNILEPLFSVERKIFEKMTTEYKYVSYRQGAKTMVSSR